MRVCLYARVASPDQLALNYQSKRLKDFAAEHHLDVVETAAEFGAGVSAGRSALSHVEALAVEGKIDAIMVTELSRLFRDVFLYGDFHQRMRNCGVRIFTLDSLQRLI